MEALSFKEVVGAVNGIVIKEGNNFKSEAVCIDSRKIVKDSIFIAIKGENFNGNKFAVDSLNKGAKLAIVDEEIENLEVLSEDKYVIKVENCRKAILDLAKYYREKLDVKVVGITGSTGKTSTKDVLAALLSDKYKVFKTQGNFNNEIGMPLMIFSLDNSYDVAVLEMGMSDFGEIERLAKTATPDIAVITNIGLSHIENLKSRDGILKAKMEITSCFNENNVLVINNEDDKLKTVEGKNYKIVKIGFSSSNLEAINIKLNEENTEFTLVDGNNEQKFNIPLIGKHNVLNTLLGIAVCRELNVSYEEMRNGLKNLEKTSMRLELIKTSTLTIVNDAYNASPDSMKAAIDYLSTLSGRKIAILGTMRELGEESYNSHKEIGKYAKEKNINTLLVTGDYKEGYKDGFGEKDLILFDNKEELISSLKKYVASGDNILVKASRGMKFEEIVKFLKENL